MLRGLVKVHDDALRVLGVRAQGCSARQTVATDAACLCPLACAEHTSTPSPLTHCSDSRVPLIGTGATGRVAPTRHARLRYCCSVIESPMKT